MSLAPFEVDIRIALEQRIELPPKIGVRNASAAGMNVGIYSLPTVRAPNLSPTMATIHDMKRVCPQHNVSGCRSRIDPCEGLDHRKHLERVVACPGLATVFIVNFRAILHDHKSPASPTG